ncbi:phosphate acetyltransferase [Helicobacter baculiformis]|uniref:Phosphate acetyltransferase n=1 Tax=Helicobacter baculiformis TaxID=427351 RepID=A0ABV7ZLA8_9HELI|nr:phosphate acetyltransferase [Helicobacter baculiformis]
MGCGILVVAPCVALEDKIVACLSGMLNAQHKSFKVMEATFGLVDSEIVTQYAQSAWGRWLDTYEALRPKQDYLLLRASALETLQALEPNIAIKLAQHLNLLVVNGVQGGASACALACSSLAHANLANPLSFAHGYAQQKPDHIVLDIDTLPQDLSPVFQVLQQTKSACVSPVRFQTGLLKRAKGALKTIVLPESQDPRILQAAHTILQNQAAKLILLGEADKIHQDAQKLGLDLQGCTLINPNTSEHLDAFANTLYALRQSKGLSLQQAQELVKTPTYFGTMLVYSGHADGMVSGATHTTADTVRPALQTIKLHPGVNLVSSVFFMCLDTRVLVFADCAINPNPTSEELAHIALSSARTARSFGIEPRVAMLSYSTGTSGKGVDVDKVHQALEIARSLDENLLIDGPLQFDAAIDPKTGAKKMPGSSVAGQANVFIFPDLDAGNIAYKAVQRTAKTLAIGPVLQGLKKPVNDLSRGCLVEDVINTIIITAIQAQG